MGRKVMRPKVNTSRARQKNLREAVRKVLRDKANAKKNKTENGKSLDQRN